MRILLVADPGIPVPPVNYGGIERIVDTLARVLTARGHEVGLAADASSQCPCTHFTPWQGKEVRSAADTLRNSLALRRATKDFRPDLVHSFARIATLWPLRFSAVPVIMSYQRHVGARQIRTARALVGRGLTFTGCSEFISRQGLQGGGQWEAIPNFIDPAQIGFAASVPSDAPLLFLSRIERIKGPDLAIKVAKAAGRRLILAGNHAESGPELEYWRDQVEPHIGHDGISYVGPVDNKAKDELLRQAAALLVPIQWDEPFGIVFAEALAAGTPVITCRRGATPEIVEEGRTGFFGDSTESLVKAVGRLGEINRELCRQQALARFSSEVVTTAYESLYARRVSGRR